MVAADQASLAEIAKSINVDEVPFKLRCAICSQFALNAFRLPCCEQAICESCQSSLSESCPVCEHRPLTPDLCKPNKALRTTLKAYLRTAEKKREEKKRELERAQAGSTPSATPAQSVPPETPATPSGDTTAVKREETESIDVSNAPVADITSTVQSLAAANVDLPHPSIEIDPEVANDGDAKGEDASRMKADGSEAPSQDQGAETGPKTGDVDTQSQQQRNGGDEASLQGQMQPNSMGFDMNGFPNMGMNMSWNNPGDFNQMQYMNGMMNGMPNFPNMMGMPGMGMDPMTAGMYSGFGGPGMGMANMTGMNMGMNFNANQGGFAGWNGQNTMWNGSQNSNNPNAFANGMGDFGSNPGYGGYNMSSHQGNYQQQYPNNDYQGYHGQGFGRGRGRGRGRGFGFQGRGGFNQNFQGNHANNQGFVNQQQQLYQAQITHKEAEPASLADQSAKALNEEQIKKFDNELAPGGVDDAREAISETPAEAGPVQEQAPEDEKSAAEPAEQTDGTSKVAPIVEKPETEQLQPVKSVLADTSEVIQASSTAPPPADHAATLNHTSLAPPTAPLGPAAQYGDHSRDFGIRGRGRAGAFRGRGSISLPNGHSFSSSQPAGPDSPIKAPTEPKGLGVAGAPTGPKAMREGLPNTGLRGRGSGFQIVGKASMASHTGLGSRGPERSRSASRSNRRDESRSRSPSRHRRRRHRRHRSRSASESDDDRERRRDRRHRKFRREEEDENSNIPESREEQSRSPSVESSRKSSHRHHRDRDRHDRHKHRSSHRSRHHRSRSPSESKESRYRAKGSETPRAPEASRSERDPNINGVEEDDGRNGSHRSKKDRSTRYDEDREGRHHDKKRSRRERSVSPNNDEEYPRHRSRRQKRDYEDENEDDVRERPAEKVAEPEEDPHTLEREARNRERMLKEQQRRDAMNAEAKRRDTKQDRKGGGRRVSYKYEDETQAARIEQEREAARWR